MAALRFTLPFQPHRALSRRAILATGGALLAAGSSSAALAQTVLGAGKTPPHLRFLQPDASSRQAGYSHVVEATVPGRIVYIAGQLGVDRDGRVVGDIRAQAVQTFENLKAALAAVGADFHDVVKFNNYLVDRAHLPIFREVRDSYLPANNRPASTTIAISGLAREGALIP